MSTQTNRQTGTGLQFATKGRTGAKKGKNIEKQTYDRRQTDWQTFRPHRGMQTDTQTDRHAY